jgi:hypothetical protein
VTSVAAHDQTESHHYVVHFPPHPARTSDPHYVDFNHYHKKYRAAARCYVGERVGFTNCHDAQGNLCVIDASGQQSGLELHHAHVEFSLQQGISLEALETDFPGISDTTDVGAWVETDVNFRWLCVTEGSPVLMSDGSAQPIEDVAPGDWVITEDGSSDVVVGVSRKRYRGEVVSFGSAAFTPEHRLLSGGGWVPAAEVLADVGVHGSEVIRLRGEEQQVLSGVVRAVSIDMMDPFHGKESSTYPLLHNQDMLHDVPTVVSDSDVAGFGRVRSLVAGVPLLQPVQSCDPALVRAIEVGASTPVWASMEVDTADLALKEMRWITTMPSWASYSGWVHDLSVAHNHSFVAGGIVAHNCVTHHRGHAGAHTASHSDWEAGQYILGLIA